MLRIMPSKKQIASLAAITLLICIVAISATAYKANGVPEFSDFLELQATVSGPEDKNFLFLSDEKKDDASAQIVTADFSTLHDGDFLFVSIRSSIYCGTHGCKTVLYKRNGGSYRKIQSDIVANIPVYRKSCGKLLSLIFSPAGGLSGQYNEWRYAGGHFSFLKKYPSLEDASKCHL